MKIGSKYRSFSLFNCTLIFLFACLHLVGCSRSPYEGAGAYRCQDGDRVIINERLFCVYDEMRISRPSNMMVDGGLSDMNVVAEPSLDDGPIYCPPELPNAYVYETLTLCTEGEVALEIIEAVIAQWSLDYATVSMAVDGGIMTDSTDPSTLSDMQVSDETSIGVLPVNDMGLDSSVP
jgi:hypothetical protein